MMPFPPRWVAIRAIVVMAVLMAGGCAGRKHTGGTEINFKPELPPSVPAPQTTAIDPALQQQARAELQSAAKSNDPVLRSHAIEGMRDAIGDQAADEVTTALSDPDPLVRMSACLAAGDLQLRNAHAKLAALADDKDESVRVAAKYALHRIGDSSRTHDLEKTSKSPDPRIRAETATVLGMLQEPSAIKVLMPMLFDPVATVRIQAAGSLWRLGNTNGLDALIAASISKYADDQMVAILALAGPHDRRVLGHVEGALTNPDEMVCLVAARAAGMVGSDHGYGVALKGIKSADPRQRLLGALAFGAIGRSDSQQYLAPLLKDPDTDVRIAAATALLQLKAPA